MLPALAVPSLLLALVLAAGAGVLLVLRASCLRGMGQRPMLGLSRATYPTARGGECLARRDAHASDASATGGDAGRWDKHGAGPRPASPALPLPHSRLRTNVPQALPAGVLGARGGGAVGKHRFPEGSASLPLSLVLAGAP